jgi:RHS repeat-associated protein
MAPLVDYRYDNTANRVGVTEASGDRVTWTYDATYQLTRERRSGVNSYDVTHVYDPAGNRTLKLDGGSRTTSVYNGANQIIWSQDGFGRTTITYDADGNLTREVKPSGQITTSVWDAENMNSAVLLPDTTRVTYTYNADHLRVRKETASGTRKYVFDLQNPFTETDGSDVTQAVYVVEPQTYGNIVSQRQLVGGIWNSVYYHFDALGSTGSLSDGMAVVTDTYNYTAFGETKASTGATTNVYTWVGELGYFRDSETGSYNLRERPYEPDKARMKNPDPLGLEIDPNEYRVVGNNPVNAVDPSGMDAEGGICKGTQQPPSPSFRALQRMLPAGLLGEKYAVGGFGGYSSKYSFRIGNRQAHHQHCPGRGPSYTTPIIERNGKYMRAADVQAEISAANAELILLMPADFDAIFEARGADTDLELLVKCPKPPPRIPKERNRGGTKPCPAGSPEPQKPCVVTDTFRPSFVAHMLGEEAGTIRAYYPCNSDTDREIAEQTLRLARIRSGLTELRDDIAIAIEGAQVAVVISLGGAGEFVSGAEAVAEFTEDPTWTGFLSIVGMVVVSGGSKWFDEGGAAGGSAGGKSRRAPSNGPRKGLAQVPVSGAAKNWWPRISAVADDWAVKGAHIHVDGIELAVRPDHTASIVFRPVFSSTPDAAVKAASKISEEALKDIGFRQRLYNACVRAINLLDGKCGRSAELRFLIAALEKMGV